MKHVDNRPLRKRSAIQESLDHVLQSQNSGDGFKITRSTQSKANKPVSLGRHSRNCTVCAHKNREEIEREFVNWTGATAIAKQFALADRTAVYRHAHAFGLFPKRQRNIRAALEKIIEKAGEVEVTSAAVVTAVQAYAKINTQGQWIDRSEHVNLNELFDRMTSEEMETYATEGTLLSWFKLAVSATPFDGQEGENDD